jgi:Low-density lipoprotein receptor repeat class B
MPDGHPGPSTIGFRALLLGLTVLRISLASAAPARAFVHWANFAGGSGTTVGRTNTDGTGTIEDFISAAKHPIGVAVDSRYIYWANEGTNSIGRANLDGGDADAAFVTGASVPEGIAVDSQHIFALIHSASARSSARRSPAAPRKASIACRSPAGSPAVRSHRAATRRLTVPEDRRPS